MNNKMTKLKRIVALCLIFFITIGTFSMLDTSYAYTRDIFLDVQMDTQTNGVEDMVMFRYKPEKSGVYTFYQVNARKLEGYLFIKEKQPDGSKKYIQLAFSNSNPDYADYGQSNEGCFCLTHHLDAGVTYYFGVVAPYETVDKAGVSVILTCKGYDDNLIDHIEASCNSSLMWYTDGAWKPDKNKKQYFHYNISKLISNMKVTVYYIDGKSKTVSGSQSIDGMKISYIENQYENHWYSKSDKLYRSNDLTVKVLDKTATVNVNIDEGALYPVQGQVVDYVSGEPIKNVSVLLNSQNIATTDENGNFSFVTAVGSYKIVLDTDSSINREIFITVSSNGADNDFTKTPFKLVNCDYVNDEIINTKDSAFLNNSDLTQDIKDAELSKIDQLLGVDNSIYK